MLLDDDRLGVGHADQPVQGDHVDLLDLLGPLALLEAVILVAPERHAMGREVALAVEQGDAALQAGVDGDDGHGFFFRLPVGLTASS